MKVNDSSSGSTSALIEGSTISNNVTHGVFATRAFATVRLSNSTVTGNGRGLATAESGKIISTGGNVVRGNTVNGTFTATEAQQ